MAESGQCVAWRRESSCWFFISFLMEKCPSERSRPVGSTLGQDPGRGGRAGSHPHHGSTEAQVIGLLSCPPRVFSSPFLSLSPPHTRP